VGEEPLKLGVDQMESGLPAKQPNEFDSQNALFSKIGFSCDG